MRFAAFADDRIKVDVRAVLASQAVVECRSRFSAYRFCLVDLKGAFDEAGDGATLASSKTVGELARLGAADDEPWFGQGRKPP